MSHLPVRSSHPGAPRPGSSPPGPSRTLLSSAAPTIEPLSPDQLAAALGIRDLTDPTAGRHAVQSVVDLLVSTMARRWPTAVEVVRSHPIVPVDDNYDRLGYGPAAVARDTRYTRYVSETCMLRTHTSAMVPDALRRASRTYWRDLTIVCPGMVHRRDAIDRTHTGTPHQVDLWRLRRGRTLGGADLEELVRGLVAAVLPDHEVRLVPAAHPYTRDGRQIDARPPASGDRAEDDGWLEVGECGLAAPAVLRSNGHDPALVSGLAVGLGLDRLVMLRKGIDDIRLLRSTDERVARQLLDLAPWRPVSHQPSVTRDVSIVLGRIDDEELVGDRVRELLGERAAWVESVRIVTRTPVADLPPAALARLGLDPGTRRGPDEPSDDDVDNALVRVVLRGIDRTLTDADANAVRDVLLPALGRTTPSRS